MPHSSGGGSHGGGHHGGHGHGGRGGSGVRLSHKPFKGSRRFIYYHSRRPAFVYSNKQPDNKENAGSIIAFAVMLFLTAAFSLLFFFISLLPPSRLDDSNISTKIVIEDDADIITDEEEEELADSLKAFHKVTGIVPSVVTVNNEDWQDDYRNLEKYSYDRYLAMFSDEKHWLIVYSEPEVPDEDFNDWYWEGMQGDDTDRILTVKKADIFNKKLHKLLLQRDRYTVAEAICSAFDDLTPKIMGRSAEQSNLVGFLLIFSFSAIGGTVLLIVGIKAFKKFTGAFEVGADEVIRQTRCNYCGGIYVAGHHTNCPYCQAQVPYEYTPSGANNTTSVV